MSRREMGPLPRPGEAATDYAVLGLADRLEELAKLDAADAPVLSP
ncbi:hypothetical protein [Planobispora rosea]|nr:hypothetical protein [Planobispora rosea]